jgi:hypothetical protein
MPRRKRFIFKLGTYRKGALPPTAPHNVSIQHTSEFSLEEGKPETTAKRNTKPGNTEAGNQIPQAAPHSNSKRPKSRHRAKKKRGTASARSSAHGPAS